MAGRSEMPGADPPDGHHGTILDRSGPPLQDRRESRCHRSTAEPREDRTGGHVTRYTDENSNFGAEGPFFHIIREGLEGFVEGEDYFDLLADDVVVEFVISVPGYPRRVEGRQSVIDLYRDYDSYMTVRSADNLRVYRDPGRFGRGPRVRGARRIGADGPPLRQSLRLHRHRRERQGDMVAGLPRPRGGLRCRRLAPGCRLVPQETACAPFGPAPPPHGVPDLRKSRPDIIPPDRRDGCGPINRLSLIRYGPVARRVERGAAKAPLSTTCRYRRRSDGRCRRDDGEVVT